MTSRDPQMCCEAVLSAILATAWLLVKNSTVYYSQRHSSNVRSELLIAALCVMGLSQHSVFDDIWQKYYTIYSFLCPKSDVACLVNCDSCTVYTQYIVNISAKSHQNRSI